MQAALAAGGLYRGPIDGNMSGSLRASIRQFQQISGLPQSGILDAETMARLTRSSTSGGSGSNGNTSTAGNLSASQPFTPSATPTATTPQQNPTIFSTPFPLAQPINNSTAPPAGTLIQP